MISLGELFSKYSGYLRRFKWVYVLNNLFNAGRLKHNRALYRKYGVNKSIFAPIGSGDFPEHRGELPWLDRPGAREALEGHPDFASFPEEIQAELRRFVEDGYMILRGFYSAEEVARLNAEVDRLREDRRVDFNYTGRKIMDAFRNSEIIDREYFRNPELLSLLNFTLGRPVIPFQTIHFIRGSEQRAHSDSIHMTTEPPGYLIATWTALEECSKENGTLFYYPGSHRLPYVTTEDYSSGNTAWTIGHESNKRYEDHIEALVARHGLEKKYFDARPGDLLIWHANLLHGGGPILREGATRRSMVSHYFCEGVICYHEISQRPALMDARLR